MKMRGPVLCDESLVIRLSRERWWSFVEGDGLGGEE